MDNNTDAKLCVKLRKLSQTCPVETITGSFINSREIGQRKSSGITGDLCLITPLSPSDVSTPGFSISTKSFSFLSRDDMLSKQSPGSPPLAMTNSWKARDSFFKSLIVLSCSFSESLFSTAGSGSFSFCAADRSRSSCKSGESGLPFALLN